jgi:hypothetical protein
LDDSKGVIHGVLVSELPVPGLGVVREEFRVVVTVNVALNFNSGVRGKTFTVFPFVGNVVVLKID